MAIFKQEEFPIKKTNIIFVFMQSDQIDNNPEKNKRFIDLESVIRKKNPRLLKALPGFIIKYLKKTIHENEINEFIANNKHKNDFVFIDAIVHEFGFKINLVGTENIPTEGGVILASNHPLGGIDGVAFMKAVGTVRKDLKFLVNDILLNLENLKDLFIPVNKHGRNSGDTMDVIDSIYASDQAVLIFPAGLVSRKQSGAIKDLEWKKSFVAKAKQHKKNIVPVYIQGKNSRFFYNLSWLRKGLKIKANIEMFYLVDEMYRQKNQTITLIFGKPIDYRILNDNFTDKQWAEKIKDHVYNMGKSGTPLEFQK